MTKVFISYSHDSASHKLRVLEFANRLRRDGVDASLDRYVQFTGLEWHRWMLREIADTDRILVICSPTYKERSEQSGQPTAQHASPVGGLILDETLYGETNRHDERVIAVLLDETPTSAIPIFLQAARHFRAPDQYAELLQLIGAKTEAPVAAVPTLSVVSDGAIPGLGWSAARESAIAILRERWKARQLTLMVGAGTSAAVGIPLWGDLIAHMVGAYVEKTYAPSLGSSAVDPIRSTLQDGLRTLSPIQIAEFIQSKLTSDELTIILRECLYRNASPQDFSSPLLNAIVALHDGLHGIVSFNFDDALEIALEQAGLAHTTIVRGRDLANTKGLPIYHPHGFLPRSGTGSESIVFAESQYHSQYISNHSWSNIVVQRLLLESTCLFVGTSLSDPNLRRMIDLAHRENDAQQHFYLAITPRAAKSQHQPAILEIFQAAHESMGITPIWLEHYDQVPEFLREINR